MDNKKLKVVWICSVSNETLRHHLDFSVPLWHRVIRGIVDSAGIKQTDYAHWNTNAIKEFEKFDDVDLHIIFVHGGMRRWLQRFEERGIHYYAVSKGDTTFSTFACVHLLKKEPSYGKTHRIIAHIVNDLHPDLIHVMGAENPPYSPSVFLLPKDIPIIVTLQTMLQESKTVELQPQLRLQQACERDVLMRADYIGSRSKVFLQIARKYVKENVTFVNARLLLGEKANYEPCDKHFDFVYFASYISKAIDLAIEAFGLAYKKNTSLTLDVIGSASEEELKRLNSRLDELGCRDAVTIEGKLPTHEDVLAQIRKSRFALLPLKIDAVSGTIREAMWNGLPVVSTITTGSPILNQTRESALLSPIGDHEAMATNMIRLTRNPDLAARLMKNAAITVEELYGNNALNARLWVDVYKACIENFGYGTPLPESVHFNI